MNKLYLKLVFCIIVATLLALTSHIYISEFTRPLIGELTAGMDFSPDGYSRYIIITAYGTAFVTVSLLVFLYYQAGHLLNISNRFLKSIVLAIILLEIKGNFFRQPLMDYLLSSSKGVNNPLYLIFLNQADQWAANLLLALVLVYFCPLKRDVLSGIYESKE